MEPATLSLAFVKAYNERDADTIRVMLHPDVTYVRPGPSPLDGVDAIMGQYEKDWRAYDATIEVRQVIEAEDTVAVELALTSGDGRIAVEAVVLHRWADDRMVDYRLYLDPIPG